MTFVVSVFIIVLYQMSETLVVEKWPCRRKAYCLFKRENFTFSLNWLCIEDSSTGRVNIKKDLMKPWGMTVSKVHIIYGEVTVGSQPVIPLHCFWWPENHEQLFEFFGQGFVIEPEPSWQPFLTVSKNDWQIHACMHTQYHIHAHYPAQWLWALVEFLNPVFWVGGSGLPENNGTG